MAAVDLATGSTFAGRYKIVGRLASGGMGAVYEALHLETRRKRALKVMLPELFSKPELRDRFRREAHVTSSVKSEFLVDVFDAGLDEASGMPFLVMELLEGQDLGRLVDRNGPLAPSDVVTYLGQVASALDRTHAASVVHRDLKPENLFLTHREDGSGCIKILDFGISKIVSEVTAGRNTTNIGTPAYMAPEQITGGPVSPAADLHALGLIAFTLLTGRAYWQDDVESTDNALAFALRAAQGIREGAVSRAHRHGHTLPAAFDAWFARAAHLDPNQRFQSASETVQGLAEVLGVPVPSVLQSASSLRAGSGRGSAAQQARSDGEQGPSTMHGAELAPRSRKPSARVRMIAAAVVLGAVGVAVAAYVASGKQEPATGSSADDATRSNAAATAPSAVAPIVLPPQGALSPGAAAAAPAAPSPESAPARSATKQALPAPSPKPATSGAARPASAPSSTPAAPVASVPATGATASFPVASGAPKPKYTRD
jgi:serine/threonine-protein kinase